MFKLYLEPVIFFTFGVLFFFLGIIIFRENPKQRINRVTGIMILLAGFGTIFGGVGSLLNSLNPELQTEFQFMRKWLLLWEFFFPQLLYFSLIFPQEQKIFTRIRKKVFLLYIPHIFHFIIVFIFTNPQQILNIGFVERFKELFGIISLPFYYLIKIFQYSLSFLFSFHIKFFAIVNIIYIFSALLLLYKGFTALRPSQFRKQVAIIIWGLRSSIGIYTIAYIFPLILPLHFSENLKFAFTAISIIIGSGSIGWAIIKYKFLDIQIIIRKSLVFSVSSGLLVGIYIIIYNQIKGLSGNIFSVDVPIVEVMFIIFAVLLFQPILSGVEKLIEKMFVKERENYQNILRMVSSKLMVFMDIGKLVSFLKNEVRNYLMLENIEVFLKMSEKSYVLFGNEEISIGRRSELIEFLESSEDLLLFDRIVSHIHEKKTIEIFKSFNPRYILSLKYRGRLEGFLCLSEKLYKTEYSFDDVTFLNLVSNQIVTAIENARLYEETIAQERLKKELHLARDIQNALLPNEIPRGEKFEMSALNIQCDEVGGDYFDIIKIDENSYGIAIGDISGKGVPGSLLMSNLQASVRTSTEFMKDFKQTEINKIMSRVNNHMVKSTSPEQYATFFYALLNQKNNSLIYSNAGHNYPILINRNGDVRLLKKGGMALGFLENLDYEKEIVKLKAGDILIFYTDGITEALNLTDVEFSENRLVDIVKLSRSNNANEIKNTIYNELSRFTDKVSQYDDITLLVMKILKD